MLRDFGEDLERSAAQRRAVRKLRVDYGRFIAGLAPWSWFVNPLTLRDDPDCRFSRTTILKRVGNHSVCEPDPRIESHRPWSRYSLPPGIPKPWVAVARVRCWLADIEATSGGQIGWVLAEEFGRIGGRWHCHILISGVSHLSRRYWWAEAFRRFGYTRIVPFDPARGAAYYAAKYAGQAVSTIHFGGTLGGHNLTVIEQSDIKLRSEGREVVKSPELEQAFFKLGLRRWHR